MSFRSISFRRELIATLASAVLAGAASAQPAPTGLQNPGFELGAVNSPPPAWTTTGPIDAVTVATEGAAQFDLYLVRGIDVAPYRGTKALRIGRPRNVRQTQAAGETFVLQSFSSVSPRLLISARFFSWETSGADKFFVRLVDASRPDAHFTLMDAETNLPFSLPLPGAPAASCSSTPCTLPIAMRGRDPLLDSGWRTIEISGLPTDGRQLTLSLGQVNNSTKPSWVYFDETRRPPVARMTITPASRQLEGDFVFFDCTSSTFDESGELSCLWEVSGADFAARTVTGPYAIFNFPESNDPSLLVKLTVSDGASSATTTSNFAVGGALEVENAAPVVSALNVEIPQGGSGELLCRYLDLGVLDTHNVSIQVGGAAQTAALITEHDQAYATGSARARFDASGLPPGDVPGSCTVTDDEGASTSAPFIVRVAAAPSGRFEPANNSSNTAPRLPAGWTYAFDLGGPKDVDVFEVRLPNGGALPANSEIELELDSPADYDLVVLSRAPGLTVFEGQTLRTSPFLNSPFLNSPFLNSPFLNSPFLNSPATSPFLNSPFLNSPFLNSPFLNSPFLNSPFLNSPLAFGEIPLSQLAGAPSGSTISASDIGLDELGSFDLSDLEDESLVVKAISAGLGTTRERSLVRIGPDETALFVAIVSHDGGFSTTPFRLSIQVSQPFDREARLGANCIATPKVPAATATSTVEVLHAGSGAPKSIGVIQRQRFQLAYHMTDAEFDAWLAQIAPALDHPEIAMRLVSAPSTWFDAADSAPCNVAAQNATAHQLKTLIQSELAAAPSAASVVLFGDQSVIPHYAETDGTDIANERFYGGDALVREDTPLAATIAGGFNLVDSFYTSSGLPFGGRRLWIEERPIGRLAKYPTEIAEELASFVALGGLIVPSNSLVTGYDFFADGSARSQQVLQTLDPTTHSLNSSSWTAAELRCQAFGIPAPNTEAACEIPSTAVVNLHGTHFAGLSANGFNTGNYADFVDTTDASGRLGETFTASLGCHTGLDVPKAWSIPQAFGLLVDPAFDWAQQAGIQIRPINYGIGHTDFADRGTEGLVTEVTRRAAGGLQLGEALVAAKTSYLLSLRQVDVYDEDSVISLALVGLPQWRIAPAGSDMPQAPTPIGTPGTSFGSLALTVRELGSSLTFDTRIGRVTTPHGEYFTLNGNADAPHARAIQGMREVFADRVAVGTRVHDVALRGGNYTVIRGFDPVIATFTQEWLTSQPEPKACIDTMSPTQIGTVNSVDVGGQTQQTLLFTGTQFECTLPALQQGIAPVTGDERVFSSATIEALHPVSAAFDSDFQPPRVTRQDVVAIPSSGDVELTLDASDASGLREVIALVFEDLDNVPGGPGRAVSYSTGNLIGVPGPHSLTLPGAMHKLISLQYVDGAGNVLLKSFKGKLFEAIPVDIETSIFVRNALTTISVRIGAFASLAGPVLDIDFGDGTSAVLPLTDANGNPAPFVWPQPDGSAIATVDHDYSGATGNALTVVARVSAQGAGGTDTETLYNCGDPLGDIENASGDVVSCAATAPGGVATFDLNLAGEPSIDAFVYRVSFPRLGTQLSANPDGALPHGASLSLLPNGVRLEAPGALIGWDGTSPLDFRIETLRRANGSLADQTLTFTLTP